jgi:hypothetical protein
MESASKQASTAMQSCSSRREKRHPPKVDYYAELNTWVQRAIQEAEKNKDFNKKNQFLILLKDL